MGKPAKQATSCCAAGPLTLRRALSQHSDLLGPITKQALQAFAAHAQVPRPQHYLLGSTQCLQHSRAAAADWTDGVCV